MSPYHVRPLRTSLLQEEVWRIDDIAHAHGLRRSHITRAMLRFVLSEPRITHDFLNWLKNEHNVPTEATDDPQPHPRENTE